MDAPLDLSPVLARWGRADADASALGRGLINQTWMVEGPAGRAVLQRLSPIFDAAIHHNIVAVTEHLAQKGVTTPRLLATEGGERWIELDPDDADTPESLAGVWRLQSAIPGVSFDALTDADQARAAGDFVGRWHAALADLDHEFVALRAGVHDTPKHLASLRAAVDDCARHRLHGAVAPLAAELLTAAEALPPMPASAPARVAHGDLKINNLIFAGDDRQGRLRPVALIDLDTVAPMTLGYELGDAWRSWCNRATEDEPDARFDLELFTASLAGWRGGWRADGGAEPDADERRGMLLGPEWISLELACRFAADALREAYFGWDRRRFPGRGEHNLARARGQWSLHRAVLASRPQRADALGV